jgi:two-component system CheB/CheR fusion protein
VRLRHHAFDSSPVAQIVVDPGGTVVQISRQAREMFGLTEQDKGRPLQDLEASYRPVELRSVLEHAYAQGSSVVLKDVEWRRSGESLYYEIQVTPLTDLETLLPLGAEISFIDVTQAARLQQQLRRTNAELQEAFEQLQSTSEELETTNEELQSTNEELETTNEELQSTNEELETINEELQSTNHAQQALNEEVRHRSDDLVHANLSLEAILATLHSAVVVIDRDLQVKRWSARAEDLWGLRADEVVGKNLMGLDIGLPVEKLAPKIRACFIGETVSEVALEATNRRGRPIGCKVACLRLSGGDDEVRGVILVIAETAANAP